MKIWEKKQQKKTMRSINTKSNIPQNSSCTANYRPSQRQSKLDEQDMQDTAGGARIIS